MGKLLQYQAYAERCAMQLGVETMPLLRWSGEPCTVRGRSHAHCHIKDGAYPRGTICLSRTWFAAASTRERRHCLGHEVVHLAVKSNHKTPTFDRRMVVLGLANLTLALPGKEDVLGDMLRRLVVNMQA